MSGVSVGVFVVAVALVMRVAREGEEDFGGGGG